MDKNDRQARSWQECMETLGFELMGEQRTHEEAVQATRDGVLGHIASMGEKGVRLAALLREARGPIPVTREMHPPELLELLEKAEQEK